MTPVLVHAERSVRGNLRAVLLTAAACLATAAIGAIVPLAASHHALGYLMAGAATAAAVGVLFVLAVNSLPTITIFAMLLVPIEATQVPLAARGIALSAIPLAVWIIRAHRGKLCPQPLIVLALLFASWLALSEALAPLHTRRGLEWLVIAAIALVAPIVATPRGLDPRRFRGLFLTVMTVIAVYGVVEALLRRNVLFGWLYDHSSWWPGLQQGGSYRITTVLGHPLVNGTLFAAAGTLAASELMEHRGRPARSVARLAVLVAAVLATHSRGAAVALGSGVALVIIFTRVRWRGQDLRRLVLVIMSVAAVGLLVTGLRARDDSHAGQASAALRVSVLSATADLLHTLGPLGSGPGSSQTYAEMVAPTTSGRLENSYAELAVSLGIGGALLAIGILLTPVGLALLRPSAVGEGAALLSIAIAIAGYNAIEAHPTILVVLAVFLIAALTKTEEHHGELPVFTVARPGS